MVRKILPALVAALLAGGAHAAELVTTNGGFELGDLSSWTATGYVYADHAADPLSYPDISTTPDGSAWVATFSDAGSLSRSIATTVGQQYTFSFWLENTSIYGTGQFVASFGGTSVLNQTNGFKTDTVLGAHDAWTKFSYDVVATSTLTDITLSSMDNPSGYFGLDNVSVTSVSAVPEPASLGMMLVGLSGLGVLARRRKA